MRYTVILDPNSGSGAYTVTVPSLPGCVAQSATFDDVVANTRQAIAGFIETLATLGEPVPQEDEGRVVLRIDARGPVVTTAHG